MGPRLQHSRFAHVDASEGPSKSLSQTFCGDMMMFKDVQDFMPGESATTRQYRAIFL